MEKFISVNQEAGKRFYLEYQNKGKVVMVNLLKFKPMADYTGLEHLNPGKEISGKEAYDLYMKCTAPHLKKAGSKVLFLGASGHFVIGPEQEKWDLILLVEHESVNKFMEFAQDTEYLKTAGHRTAALENSRLMPATSLF